MSFATDSPMSALSPPHGSRKGAMAFASNEDSDKDPFAGLQFDTSTPGVIDQTPRDVRQSRCSIRRPSQYSGPSRKSSLVAAAASTRHSTVEATQSHPTALPNEFLALIRTFRMTVETAINSAMPDQQEDLRTLQQVCSQIVRIVTSFLIQKYEDQSEYERKKLLGWSGADSLSRKNVSVGDNAEVVGPLLLSALYVVCESLLHLLKCDRLYLFMPDGTKLKAVVSVGASTVSAPLFYDLTHGSCGVVFSSGVALNIPDAERAPPQLFSRHSDELSLRGYYIRNTLCFPLLLPQDEPTALGPAKGRGVLAAYNKVKNSIYPSGFTAQDEEMMHHYSLLVASILKWGNKVEFCSNTSQEESSRLQQLLLVNKFCDPLATRRTTGGTSTQTRLEATQRMRKQREVEAAKEAADEKALVVQHNIMRMTFRASSLICTRIYRTPGGADRGGEEPSSSAPLSFILSEASHVVATGGNMRELMLMLDQADTAWKGSRQDCASLRDRISKLEASLNIERKRRFELEELCRSCGITLPVPSAEEEAIRLGIPQQQQPLDDFGEDLGATVVDAASQPPPPPAPHRTYEEVAARMVTAQHQQHTYDRKVLEELQRLERGMGLLLDDKDMRLPDVVPGSRPASGPTAPFPSHHHQPQQPSHHHQPQQPSHHHQPQQPSPRMGPDDVGKLIERLTGASAKKASVRQHSTSTAPVPTKPKF